jgi:membrane protein YdbS with pleckstrin-like domain
MSVRYINILKSIEITEKRRKSRKKNYKNDLRFFFIILALGLSSIAMVFIYYLTKIEWLKLASLFLLLLVYLTAPVMQIYSAYRYRSKIKRSFTLPLCESLNLNIKTELSVDTVHFPALKELTREELELGLLEIKNERALLEKRMNIMIGPIDKLGILPGIVATITALTKIPESYSWVSAIAYGYMGLSIFSLFFYQLIMRYERMIALTELALESKSPPLTT